MTRSAMQPQDREPAEGSGALSIAGVQIEGVCTHEVRTEPGRRAVCASVCLPDHTPAMVVVELTLRDAAGDVIGSDRRRMWSEQSLDVGRFMYVARVDVEELARATTAIVAVHELEEREPAVSRTLAHTATDLVAT